MTYASFIPMLRSGQIRPEDLTAIVMDEAHRGLSENRWTEFLKLKEKVPIFAFSASPSFDAMKDVHRLLDKESEVFSTTVRELAQSDPPCLAPVANYLYRVKVDIHNGDEPLERADREEIFFKAKLQAALEFLVDYTDPQTGNSPLGQSSLFFTKDTARAKQAAEFFETGLRSIMQYKGDDPLQQQRKQRVKERLKQFSSLTRYTSAEEDSDREQENIIKQLNGGQLMAAFNAKLFEEGTDIKRVKNVFNLDTTESLVTALQRGGRGIRFHKDMPDAQCNIIDMFIEYQGEIQGNPQFYADAIDDPSLAVTLTTAIGVDGKGKIINPGIDVPEPPRADQPVAATPENKVAVAFTPPIAASAASEKDRGTSPVLSTKEKPASTYPIKTADWMNEEEFSEAVFANVRPTVPQKRELKELLHDITAHHETFKHDKYPPLFQLEGGRIRAETRLNNGKLELCMQHAAVQLAQDYIGVKRSKTSMWKTEEEFAPLVIGTGEMAKQMRQTFHAARKAAEKHTLAQEGKEEKEPFRFNGEAVRMEVLRTDEGKIKVCAHEGAAYQFRHALGVPRNKTTLDATYEETRAMVLHNDVKERRYGQDFDQLWGKMERAHEREQKGNANNPVIVGKMPLKLELVYDSETEQLQQVVPRSAAHRIEQHLEVPRDKTSTWKECNEFHQLVFSGQPQISREQEQEFRKLWQQLEQHHNRWTPNSEPMQIADRLAYTSICLTPEGTEVFCSNIASVRLFREHLKLPKPVIAWDYPANIDDIRRIQKERDEIFLEPKTDDWLGGRAICSPFENSS